MFGTERYLDNVMSILEQVKQTQMANIEECSRLLYQAIFQEHNIFAFGCSHASLVTLDLYYRSGGIATINPIKAPGLNLDMDPAEMTSQMERLSNYGNVIIDNSHLKNGDIIIIHSVSGRNTVTVDVALAAKRKGATVIALTNLNTACSMQSRHPSGLHLHDVADLVIDNCGDYGDATVSLMGLEQKVAPTSTAIGSAIMNAVVARTIELTLENNILPPVLMSANIDGGEEHNAKVLDKYREHIFYSKASY